MTIDEAIRSHKENIAVRSKIGNMDDIDKYVIECDKKYVEWLEELKAFKDTYSELDLRIKIGNIVMLMADSKFYETERKNIYNQALEDLQEMIDCEYYDGGYGTYHEVEMIVRMIEQIRK